MCCSNPVRSGEADLDFEEFVTSGAFADFLQELMSGDLWNDLGVAAEPGAASQGPEAADHSGLAEATAAQAVGAPPTGCARLYDCCLYVFCPGTYLREQQVSPGELAGQHARGPSKRCCTSWCESCCSYICCCCAFLVDPAMAMHTFAPTTVEPAAKAEPQSAQGEAGEGKDPPPPTPPPSAPMTPPSRIGNGLIPPVPWNDEMERKDPYGLEEPWRDGGTSSVGHANSCQRDRVVQLRTP